MREQKCGRNDCTGGRPPPPGKERCDCFPLRHRVMVLGVNDPDDGFDQTVVGVVEMTKELADIIWQRALLAKAIKATDPQFQRVEFSSRVVSYFEYDQELTVQQQETLVAECPVILAKSPFNPEKEERTEYDLMAVDTEDVWWRTSSKHSEAMSTTSPIHLVEIEKYLGDD